MGVKLFTLDLPKNLVQIWNFYVRSYCIYTYFEIKINIVNKHNNSIAISFANCNRDCKSCKNGLFLKIGVETALGTIIVHIIHKNSISNIIFL